MANKRIIEMDIKKILEYYLSGKSIRWISKNLEIHRKSVTDYIKRYESSKIDLSLLSDEESIVKSLGIEPKTKQELPRQKRVIEFIESQKSNKKKPGFSIENLYEDYIKIEQEEPYSRAHFYRRVKGMWDVELGSLKIEHRYGDKLFIDYAGKKMHYINKSTGEEIEVETFVSILPASGYIYAEASHNQKKESLINSTINAIEYIGGVPQVIVSDNLKSAVTKVGKYQSVINKTFKSMGMQYGAVIDPTRAYKPKDKAMVESAVKIVYNSIYYEVMKHSYFSIEELNASIKRSLEKLNQRKLTNKDVSRSDQYEIEKGYLQPLPKYSYETKEFRRAKVQKMGYILCSQYSNYYSVPYRYIGKQVEVQYDTKMLEIYYNNERIASHKISQSRGSYNTINEHLSSHNKAITEWSPEYFIKKGEEKGEDIKKYIELLIDEKAYPEMAYRQIQGIINLAKEYTDIRLNNACKIALNHKYHSYNIVKTILENRRDIEAMELEEIIGLATIPIHSNVRGSSYFS